MQENTQVSVEQDEEGATYEVVVSRNPVTREQIVDAIKRNEDRLTQLQDDQTNVQRGLDSLRTELDQFDALVPQKQ